MVVGVLTGCAPTTSQVSQAQPSWVHVYLSFLPEPPAARRYDTVTVRVVGADGGALTDTRVQWSANMVGMNHPAGAKMQGRAGRYTGRTLLAMGGDWVATVRISQGQRRATIQVPFEVRD